MSFEFLTVLLGRKSVNVTGDRYEHPKGLQSTPSGRKMVSVTVSAYVPECRLMSAVSLNPISTVSVVPPQSSGNSTLLIVK